MRAELCGVSLSCRAGTAVYIPVRSPDPKSHLDEQTVVSLLKDVMEDESIEKIGRIVHERCPVANMVVASGCALDIEWRRASAGV